MNKEELFSFINKKAVEAWKKADVVNFMVTGDLAKEVDEAFNNLSHEERIEFIRENADGDVGVEWFYAEAVNAGKLTIGFIESIPNSFNFLGVDWEEVYPPHPSDPEDHEFELDDLIEEHKI